MKACCVSLAIVMMLVCVSGCGLLSLGYDDEAVGAAESFVTSQFRQDVGFAADSLDCEVIYSGENYSGSTETLVVVTCYVEYNAVGRYCVYCMNGMYLDSTKMMPAGYDFEDNLNDVKALFGIVD